MPPDMARSFSKCSSSFWLAKFVWNSAAVARQNNPSETAPMRASSPKPTESPRSQLERYDGHDKGKADTERCHGLHSAFEMECERDTFMHEDK